MNRYKEMLLEVLLVLPLYFVIFGILLCFRGIIKEMTEISDILAVCNLEEEPEIAEEITTEDKRDFLKGIIDQGKADKLPGKTPWTVKRIEKATDKVIEKLYHEYHQADAKYKAAMTGKAIGTHVVKMYSEGVSKVVNIDNVEQLRKDIDSDPIIKESMSQVGALMVTTFGKLLAPILLLAHTVNHAACAKGVLEKKDKIEQPEQDLEPQG